MPVGQALSVVGFSIMIVPGLVFFEFAFLVSTLWSAFVRPRSAPGYLLWALALAANLPAMVFVGRAVASEQHILSSFDYTVAYVVVGSGGPGIGWLAGCIFGLLIRVGAVGAREALQ